MCSWANAEEQGKYIKVNILRLFTDAVPEAWAPEGRS